jgi:hypothetical protein
MRQRTDALSLSLIGRADEMIEITVGNTSHEAVCVTCSHSALSPTLPCPLPLVPHPPATARTARESAYR